MLDAAEADWLIGLTSRSVKVLDRVGMDGHQEAQNFSMFAMNAACSEASRDCHVLKIISMGRRLDVRWVLFGGRRETLLRVPPCSFFSGQLSELGIVPRKSHGRHDRYDWLHIGNYTEGHIRESVVDGHLAQMFIVHLTMPRDHLHEY